MTDKERIAELEKENAELQQKYLEESYEKAKLVKELKEAEDIPTIAYLQGASRQNGKISKLIEIIKDGIVIARKPIAYQDPIFLEWRKRWAEQSEAFIKDFKDIAVFGYDKSNEWHYLRKNTKDLPQCDENTQLIFYVKDWSVIRNDYYYHFALGFYRPPFVIDGGKMFVEESKGYSSEHSPEHVIMWKELVKPEVEE